MKITVFGAGAIGGHLAARLGASGAAAVSVVARGAHLAAIAARGLTLVMGEERITARIAATDRPETLGPQDVVIVTLKATALAPCAEAMRPLIGRDTTLVFAMNGIPWWYLHGLAASGRPVPDLSRLDPGGHIARTLGPERAVGCVIASANEVIAPGVVRNSAGTRNHFTLGEPDGTVSARVQAVAAAFGRAHISCTVTPAIRVDIWNKLMRNIATSPICSVTGEPIGVLGRNPELLAVGKAIMREGLAVAAASGIDLDIDVDKAFGSGRSNSTHKSSMLQDFERGRPPEIDGILTSVQAFARAAGAPTPHLDMVTALVIEKARRMGLYAG